MRERAGEGSTARRHEDRREMKEFLVMVAMGAPGMVLFFVGFKMFEWAHRVTAPGALLVGIGACLLLTCGCYHYRKDYSRKEGKRGLAFFLVLTVVPGFIGLMVARLLAGK